MTDPLQLIFTNMDKGLSAILLIYFVVKLNPILGEIKTQMALIARSNEKVASELDDLEDEVKGSNRPSSFTK